MCALYVSAGDLFDGSLLLQDVGAELWEVERTGRPKLTVMWGTDLDDFDPESQVSSSSAVSGRSACCSLDTNSKPPDPLPHGFADPQTLEQ